MLSPNRGTVTASVGMRRQGASESSRGTSRVSGACLLNRDSHFNVSAGSWCCCHSLDQPATIAAKCLGSSSVASRATSSGSHSLHSLIRLTGRQGQQSCQMGFFNRRISSVRLQRNEGTGQTGERTTGDRDQGAIGQRMNAKRSQGQLSTVSIAEWSRSASMCVVMCCTVTGPAKFLVAPTQFLLLTTDSEHHVHN